VELKYFLVHASLNDGKRFIVTVSELVANVIQHTALQAYCLKLAHINPRPVTRFRFHILRSENSFFAVTLHYYYLFLLYKYVYNDVIVIHDFKKFVKCIVKLNLTLESEFLISALSGDTWATALG
jgi:hypothetical protein